MIVCPAAFGGLSPAGRLSASAAGSVCLRRRQQDGEVAGGAAAGEVGVSGDEPQASGGQQGALLIAAVRVEPLTVATHRGRLSVDDGEALQGDPLSLVPAALVQPEMRP